MSTTPEPVEPTVASEHEAATPPETPPETAPAAPAETAQDAATEAPGAAQAETPAAQAEPEPAEPQAEAPDGTADDEPLPEEGAPAPAVAAVVSDDPAAEDDADDEDDHDEDDHDEDDHDEDDDASAPTGIESNPEAIDVADDEPATAAPEEAAPTAAEGAPPEAESPGGKRRKKKGKGGEDRSAKPEQPKRKGPAPSEVVARIGTTNEAALAYLAAPDPKLSRLSRKITEALLPDLPPVTAAALLGPAGFTRHLVASAAAGRYRDLFVLWETFRRFPEEAKPQLAERGIALAKGQEKLKTAVRIGLTGRSPRLAEDVATAEGLIWQWLREALVAHLPAVGARPAVASALLRREPDLDIPLPANPDERWLAEASTARAEGPLHERVEAVLGANVHRLPATVDTLRLATVNFPQRVPALVDRVDLDAPDIGAFLAWARDHGESDRLHGRIRERVAGTAARDKVEGLSLWYAWQQKGVALELPEALRTESLEGFDLARPETAELAARLVARGVELDPQAKLDALAAQNRQLAEKAYEAMVCANLDVTLPVALKDNPTVNPGTRCPNCQAWTWVRPGHEARCPRPERAAPEPELSAFELAAAEVGPTESA